MSRVLSHPFRLGPNGSPVTVEQDSEAGLVEQLGQLALTRRGERPVTPGFGTTDPAFAGFDIGDLAAQVQRFGIPVTDIAAHITTEGDDSQRVTVTFEPVT